MKKLLALAALCLLAACNSMQPGTGTYSTSFGASDARSSVDADYRYIGQMGGP